MSLRKELSKMFQHVKRSGIKWMMASGAPQQGVMAFNVTSGGTPDSVVFANIYVEGEQMPDMADTSYVVLVNGETAADKVSVDEDTKATTGFDILNGGAAEILNVVVIGRFADMPTVNS
jgi:hypothetical protein